jgi:hypothetical protein
MCETPSGLIILHNAAATVYWNIQRFSQLTFPKLLPSLLSTYEELFVLKKYVKFNIGIAEQYFYFHVLFIYLFITSDNADCDVNQ